MTDRVRWPVVGLALLVSSGTLKGSAAFMWLPVDLTALAAALVAIGALGAGIGAVRARRGLPVGLILGAVAFSASGLFQGAEGSYAESKSQSLLILSLGCAFVGSLLLIRTSRHRLALAWSTVVIGGLVAALARFAPSTGAMLEGRIALAGAATIAPARDLGAAIVVLVALALTKRVPTAAALPLAGALLATLISTGSRGPLVAVAIAAAAMIPFLPKGRRLRALAVLAVGVVVGARVLTGSAASVQDRFGLLFATDRGASIRAREWMWDATLDALSLEPLGRGWGGLAPRLAPLGDYPHNIILEVAAEAGLIAAAVLVIAVIIALWRGVGAARAGDSSSLAVFAMLVFWTVNALVSGDINDNRGLLVVLAAALSIRHQRVGASGTGTPTDEAAEPIRR